MLKKCFKKSSTRWIPIKKNRVHVSKTKRIRKVATFQQSLRMTLIIGQLFSLLPVSGILSNSAANVRFTVKSWKCVYFLLSLCSQIFVTGLCFIKIFKAVSSINETMPLIYYVCTCITMLMYFRVARSWPSMVQYISATEDLEPNFDGVLIYKCNITCVIVVILSLLEHSLFLISAFTGAMVCHGRKGIHEALVIYHYPWVFNILPYSTALGVLTQLLHFQLTFIWNFSDLFVMCMSYYLTSRFKHINSKLLAAQGKYLPETFWKTIRENYCRTTQLVRRVDGVISSIVFMSFANNLFFICLQLYNTLVFSLLGGYETETHSVFSLVYLFTRSMAVSLIASQVNTASYVPAPILYEVPSPVYCVEVQRLLDQIHGDNVALSGLQFFNVTKTLLLTVAGTIVTYELMMFQFTSPSSSHTTILPNVSTIAATSTV